MMSDVMFVVDGDEDEEGQNCYFKITKEVADNIFDYIFVGFDCDDNVIFVTNPCRYVYPENPNLVNLSFNVLYKEICTWDYSYWFVGLDYSAYCNTVGNYRWLDLKTSFDNINWLPNGEPYRVVAINIRNDSIKNIIDTLQI